MQVNDYVDIKNIHGVVDPADPNCEGKITGIDVSGRYAFIANTNMPFMGSYSNKPIDVTRIVERENDFTMQE